MRKILFTLLAISLLAVSKAQTNKCGIDTRVLAAEQIAAGATHIDMLAKLAVGYDGVDLQKAGIEFGARAGQIVTMRVPVESMPLLDSTKEVLLYSISHNIAMPTLKKAVLDTRADSVHAGLGVKGGLPFDGTGVYVGITDWGFDYSHINYNEYAPDNLRLLKVWDHFRLAGPAPQGFPEGMNYGTEISGWENLIAARGDTANLYSYGTHGTHVAGIAAGRGYEDPRNDGEFIYGGQAPNATLMFCSFGLGEKPWMDAVAWMQKTAQDSSRRLVINSSWGMYSFSCIDGHSLLSEAINAWSDEGIVFCTSAGNNGDKPFHVCRTFRPDTLDTLRTVVVRASDIYRLDEAGQGLIMWGQKGTDFKAQIRLASTSIDTVWESPMYNTAELVYDSIYDTIWCDTVGVACRVLIEHINPFDSLPHIQIDVDKNGFQMQLYITSDSGTVHAWNLANLHNHAGNMGCYFKQEGHPDFVNGDAAYGVSEPACAAKCISVAAHNSDIWNSHHDYFVGALASFSSHGPLINGEAKPEVSAPGVDVVSSLSRWTDDGEYANARTNTHKMYQGNDYKWYKMSGTSMSSPQVTGVVALILQANPSISVDSVRAILMRTARNDEYTGPLHERDSVSYLWGWGKVDALDAVNAALELVSIDQVEQQRLPLHVYPNPATGQVMVNTNCGQPQQMDIYTIDGRRMLTETVRIETALDVSSWPRGVYIVRVGSRTEKLVVR